MTTSTSAETFLPDEMSRANPRRKREGVRRLGFIILRTMRICFPERVPRNWLRRQILKYKQNIPREFMMGSGDVVVQVGTPQTETLARISNNIGPNGKALIIEADIDNVQRLTEFAKTTQLQNVIIVHCAADQEPGTVEFLVSKKWCGNHRIADEAIVNDNDHLEIEGTGSDYLRRSVKADTVSAICQQNGIDHIDYIEIAVNGAEVRVLRGLGEILAKTKRLFVKGHSRNKESGEPINVEIQSLLDAEKFQTFLTRPAKSHVGKWGNREGDVYAWR
ncbi:MAG: FkbM family methyltransferase [Pirellulales bacterium]